jgi:hypothetical protein
MKITVFMTPCTLVDSAQRFGGTCCLLIHGRKVHPDDGGRTLVRNYSTTSSYLKTMPDLQVPVFCNCTAKATGSFDFRAVRTIIWDYHHHHRCLLYRLTPWIGCFFKQNCVPNVSPCVIQVPPFPSPIFWLKYFFFQGYKLRSSFLCNFFPLSSYIIFLMSYCPQNFPDILGLCAFLPLRDLISSDVFRMSSDIRKCNEQIFCGRVSAVGT